MSDVLGREEIDYEAKSALETLFHAEDIKLRDPEFLERISIELDKKQVAIDNIRMSLGIEGGGEPSNLDATKDMGDFFERLRHIKRTEKKLQEETPGERRQRISNKGLVLIGR